MSDEVPLSKGGPGPDQLATQVAAEASAAEWAVRIAGLPRPLTLAFDVDGTLAPIVEDAAKASVPLTIRRQLERLSGVSGVHVAVITGRDLPSLQRMLPLNGLYRAVEHGAVVLAPHEVGRPPGPGPAEQERLKRFEDWVRSVGVPKGAELERKRKSRAIHVRKLAAQAPEQADALLGEAKEVAAAAGLYPRTGRAVLEAELVVGDKGRALQRIVRASGARTAFFAGDDRTDLPAIACAVALGGIGLFVRSAEREVPEDVSGVVDGPEALSAVLDRLTALLAPPRTRGFVGAGSRPRVRARLHWT